MPDTAFYQLVDKYFDEFKRVYPRRYRSDFGPRRTVRDVYGFVLGEEYKPGMVGTIQTFGLFNRHVTPLFPRPIDIIQSMKSRVIIGTVFG
jgi:hypothetical protein